VIVAMLLVCGGFLLAVLWLDLMFDVQMLGGSPSVAALGSIAAYYRRVTSAAAPMNYLVGAVMVTTVVLSIVDVARSRDRRRLRIVALVLAAAPIALALGVVLPNAVALGREAVEDSAQFALARGILRDHLLCLGSIVGFVAVRLRLASVERT
jgi:hypothetical protein